MSTERVVVGVDDSQKIPDVYRWALAYAQRRQASVQLLCAYMDAPPLPYWAYAPGAPVAGAESLRRRATEYVDAVARELNEARHGVAITAAAVEGEPAVALCSSAETAQAIVLGARPLTSTGAFLFGSVAASVAAHASCPVVVVRGQLVHIAPETPMVAAVDGSEHSQEVLAYAFDEASRWRRPLEVVLCWNTEPGLLVAGVGRSRQSADVLLSELTAGWREKYPDVVVTTIVLEGHTVTNLVAQSAGKAMLVIGRGSVHPHLGTVLGSVTQRVLHHAMCPVAVVGSP